MASAKDLCWNCKNYTDIVYTERDTERAFCMACAMMMPPSTEELALLFLQLTVPFKVGDKVEARTAGEIFDGTGEVLDISIDLKHGGTPVYPAFLVKLETKEHDLAPDEAYYTEVCLRKVAA